MTKRPSDRVFVALGLLAVCVAATWLDGARLRRARRHVVERTRHLAADLRLTDLCLLGDAPWLRHPTQADEFGSMQDTPGAFDHTKGGALIGPPNRTAGSHATVAEPPALPR